MKIQLPKVFPAKATRSRISILILAFCAFSLLLPSPLLAEKIQLPENLQTFADDRKPVEQLYERYLSLQQAGWIADLVTLSQPEGRDYALPVIAMRTPHAGEAVWI